MRSAEHGAHASPERRLSTQVKVSEFDGGVGRKGVREGRRVRGEEEGVHIHQHLHLHQHTERGREKGEGVHQAMNESAKTSRSNFRRDRCVTRSITLDVMSVGTRVLYAILLWFVILSIFGIYSRRRV